MDLDLLVNILDLAGTFAFALVGARIAADKGLDYGGIAFIAAIASLSGGTFTGNTSGTCIGDIYVSKIHSCSNLLIS